MIRGNNRLRSFIYSCGASLVVMEFTDCCFSPLSLIPKDRSKINLKGQILCGISAKYTTISQAKVDDNLDTFNEPINASHTLSVYIRK